MQWKSLTHVHILDSTDFYCLEKNNFLKHIFYSKEERM